MSEPHARQGPANEEERARLALISILEDEREAKQRLAEAAARWQSTFDAISDIVCVISSEHEFLAINRAGLAGLGLRPEEVRGRRCYDVVHGTTSPIAQCPCRAMLESGNTEQAEHEVGGRTYMLQVWPIKDPDGVVRSFVHVVKDITERKRAEQALKESEANLNAAQRIGQIGSWAWDVKTNRLAWSEELYRIWGLGSDTVLDYGLIESMILPEDKPLSATRVTALLRGEAVEEYEFRIVRPDGERRWLRQVIEARPSNEDKSVNVFGIMQDVTERKQAEQALELSERKYRSMVESINDVVFTIDTGGIVTYISPAIERFMKYGVAEIVGQPFAKFIHTDDIEDLSASFRRNLAGQIEPSTYRVIDKDGTLKHVHSASHRTMQDGVVTGITGTLTDYTRQHRMEQEKELVEDELRQSQKMEAVGQLAGGVAHDFNNMLAGIIGNAEMLYLKLAGNPEHMEMVERILKAGEHAANLTKQLLSFARKGQYQMVAVDVHKAIGNVAGILASTIDRRIRIKQSLRARPSTIMGDPTQIENALMNLALNARDAMPKGGELIFSTDIVEFDANYVQQHQYRMEPGPYVMISVTDTGTGMDDEIVKHIFEPFFTTKGPGKGTGLGLASVYGIAKNHKGSIECYSEPGHGTVMKVYLPLSDAPEAPAPALAVASVRAGTGSILLVDDEHMIREMAGQMLKGLGYTVATCQDGQEAVEYYLEHHAGIDLVILDMIMPRLNGREAFLLMRQVNPGVRALLASGFAADGEAQEVLKLGILGFVQKPFRMAELSARIQEALGNPPEK